MPKRLSIAVLLAFVVPTAATADPARPLDAADIRAGIAPVLAAVRACGQRARVTGIVKVSARIAPDGTIVATTIKATPDRELGACVAGAVSTARFRPTERGTSITYPFRF